MDAIGPRSLSHGRTNTRIYHQWVNMHQRTKSTKTRNSHRYSGRGITVCERWQSFENFLEDMGECPPDLSLDRIDNDGDYEPGNCRWATRAEQSRNRHTTIMVEYDGKTLSIQDWAERVGVPYEALRQRFQYGWTPERALTTPLRHKPSPSHSPTPAI